MWQTVDYKGNTVKWYEAELINSSMRIKFTCEEHARMSLEGFKMAVARKVLEE